LFKKIVIYQISLYIRVLNKKTRKRISGYVSSFLCWVARVIIAVPNDLRGVFKNKAVSKVSCQRFRYRFKFE